MGVADYQPGDYVSTPTYGPAVVRGVETDPLAGECLTVETLAFPRAIVRFPVSKLCCVRLRVVPAADALAMAANWEPPRSHSWRERMRFYGKRGGAAFAEKRRQARM